MYACLYVCVCVCLCMYVCICCYEGVLNVMVKGYDVVCRQHGSREASGQDTGGQQCGWRMDLGQGECSVMSSRFLHPHLCPRIPQKMCWGMLFCQSQHIPVSFHGPDTHAMLRHTLVALVDTKLKSSDPWCGLLLDHSLTTPRRWRCADLLLPWTPRWSEVT